jgi:hypothetical protein
MSNCPALGGLRAHYMAGVSRLSSQSLKWFADQHCRRAAIWPLRNRI